MKFFPPTRGRAGVGSGTWTSLGWRGLQTLGFGGHSRTTFSWGGMSANDFSLACRSARAIGSSRTKETSLADQSTPAPGGPTQSQARHPGRPRRMVCERPPEGWLDRPTFLNERAWPRWPMRRAPAFSALPLKPQQLAVDVLDLVTGILALPNTRKAACATVTSPSG